MATVGTFIFYHSPQHRNIKMAETNYQFNNVFAKLFIISKEIIAWSSSVLLIGRGVTVPVFTSKNLQGCPKGVLDTLVPVMGCSEGRFSLFCCLFFTNT